jgi:hypothetical protein
MRWIVSPILMVIGILMMKYTVGLTNITGRVSLAEKYLAGFGGTYAYWRIIGLGLVIFGMLWITGIVHYDSGSNFGQPVQQEEETGQLPLDYFLSLR